MKVTKCNSCGRIVDPATMAVYSIHGVRRVDKAGGKNGWFNPTVIDICDDCWQGGMTLLAVESIYQDNKPQLETKTLPELAEVLSR